MDEHLQLLIEHQRILGEFDPNKVSGLNPEWFWDRWIDLIDFRGDLQIRATNVILGRKVTIITASHIINTGVPGGWSPKRVWIEKDTYIGSRAILFNCHIGEGAVVACGACVRDLVVPPHTLVEGNPAKIIGEFKNGLWRRTIPGEWNTPYFNNHLDDAVLG